MTYSDDINESNERIEKIIHDLGDEVLRKLLLEDDSLDECIHFIAEDSAEVLCEEIQGLYLSATPSGFQELKKILVPLVQNPKFQKEYKEKYQKFCLALWVLTTLEKIQKTSLEMLAVAAKEMIGLEPEPGDEVPSKTEIEFMLEKHLREVIRY